MTKYGSWEVSWWGTGIALPSPPRYPHPGYTPPPYPTARVHLGVRVSGSNMAVGLKSVAQLSLDELFSGFQGITEVYNLLDIGRINNHFVIPGFE